MKRLMRNKAESLERKEPARRRIFSRMKERLAALASFTMLGLMCFSHPQGGISPLLPSPQSKKPPFNFRVPVGSPPRNYCKGLPEIEQWANVRGVDPMLVRAVIAAETPPILASTGLVTFNSTFYSPTTIAEVYSAAVEQNLKEARAWINVHRNFLNWGPNDVKKDNAFAAYIAANIGAGFWNSTLRAIYPASCTMSNGEWLAQRFKLSWTVDAQYCTPAQPGNLDTFRCSSKGTPRKNPPNACYGYSDFVEYVRDCETHSFPNQTDFGARVMSIYYWLKNRC